MEARDMQLFSGILTTMVDQSELWQKVIQDQQSRDPPTYYYSVEPHHPKQSSKGTL